VTLTSRLHEDGTLRTDKLILPLIIVNDFSIHTAKPPVDLNQYVPMSSSRYDSLICAAELQLKRKPQLSDLMERPNNAMDEA
jgi:hypothetical protein